MEFTIKQMLAYVKKPGTTAETLEKFIDWLDRNSDEIEYCFHNEEVELEEYVALIEGIVNHPKVSQDNLRGLWIISFGWPAEVVMKILEGVQDPYTLAMVYSHMENNLRCWDREDWEKIRDMIIAKNVSNASCFKRLEYQELYHSDDEEDDDDYGYNECEDDGYSAYGYDDDDRHFGEEFWGLAFDDAMEK